MTADQWAVIAAIVLTGLTLTAIGCVLLALTWRHADHPDRGYPTHDSPAAQEARHESPWPVHCLRCGFPFVLGARISPPTPHVVPHRLDHTTRGTFGDRGYLGLCQGCWANTTPTERVTYYAHATRRADTVVRRAILKHVAAGR